MKDSVKALAFFDLDGTLLDEKSEIRPEIAEAMLQLKTNQVLPVIATGRTETEISYLMEAANIDSDIVMNGGFIRIKGEPIFSDEYDIATLEKVAAEVAKKGDGLSFYNEKGVWTSEHNQNMINAYGFIHTALPAIDKEGYRERPVNMMLVLGVDNADHYRKMFPELKFYQNTPYSLDTVKKTISKGHAVKTLQKKMGWENVPTYGFGDGPNDLTLLEACDHKIAMENGVPELKAIADFVTKKNTEGGIIHALKHFELI